MALKFTFEKERIVLDTKFYMVPEFVAIWTHDKSRKKDKAHKLLFFIFLLCDATIDNPLMRIPPAERETEAKFKAFHNKSKEFTDEELALVLPAVDMYVELNRSIEERVLDAFDRKAAELSQVLEHALPEAVENEEDGVVTFATNTKLIAAALTKLAAIRKHRSSILSLLRNEAMTERIRGQLTLSPLVKGQIKIA